MTEKIGFIGLGNMGMGMCKNLLKGGRHVVVFDLRREPVKEVEALGATSARSPMEVAQVSEFVFSMVYNDSQTEAVFLREDGVLQGAKKGSTIIISSTISPWLCKTIAKEAERKGIDVIDAPVSGAPMAAEAGTLSIMVGGSEEVLERCRPLLQLLSKKIFHLGDIGMGEVAKLVNNAMLHYNLFGAVEGLNIAIKAGIKLEKMLDLIKSSSAMSWAIEHWDFYSSLKRKGPPAFDLSYKDLKTAIDMGMEMGYEMPIASLCLQLDIYKLPELPD
jgi:2-hydroxymethylglutarate dehydrogenase